MSKSTADTASTAASVDTAFANQALALSVQHWMDLGRGNDPITGTPDSIEEAAVRITSLFLIRLIALHHSDRLEDLSTSTIAVEMMNSAENSVQLTEIITPSLTLQLETYVTCMLYGYVNELPFHNYQHAYHVTISANKFMESMLLNVAGNKSNSPNKKSGSGERNIFGLGSNPLSLLALLFSALIHDVGHTGVSNFQRAKDDPNLAAKYKDPSLHEHHSLHIAFDELLKDEYAELRQLMFKEPSDYESFRQLVFEAVLSTDIANPARAEEAKLKYFAAFPLAGCDEEEGDENRRSSLASQISMPRASSAHNRRSSGQTISSVNSDITMDSYSILKHQNKVTRNTAVTLQSWRAATASTTGSHNSGGNAPNRRVARRHSIETISSNFSEFAADSIRMTRNNPEERQRRSSIGACGGYAPQQRRLSASHSGTSGLVGMAHELRRNSMGGGGDVGKDSGMKKSRSRRQKAKRSDSMDSLGSSIGSDHANNNQADFDDSSFSSSPPSSDDEFDGVVITGFTGVKLLTDQLPKKTGDSELNKRTPRRASNGGVPSNFGSIQEHSALTYSNAKVGVKGAGSPEIADDLRAAVVIELFLRASDVAHWYQSWDTMTHFNRRIFRELCKACTNDRGFDPRPNWFDNQAKIMETYLLPLAEQIEYIGVLRKGSGIDLVGSLESNNDLWLVRGLDVVEQLKAEADEA